MTAEREKIRPKHRRPNWQFHVNVAYPMHRQLRSQFSHRGRLPRMPIDVEEISTLPLVEEDCFGTTPLDEDIGSRSYHKASGSTWNIERIINSRNARVCIWEDSSIDTDTGTLPIATLFRRKLCESAVLVNIDPIGLPTYPNLKCSEDTK